MTDEQDKNRLAQPADKDTKRHGDQLEKQVNDVTEKQLNGEQKEQQHPHQ